MKKIPDDPRFKHVSYHHTDIRKTFARVRREMREPKTEQKILQMRKKVRA